MKSVQSIQSSINLISSKANKNPMFNIISSVSESPLHKNRNQKMTQKQFEELKKYHTKLQKKTKENTKEVKPDYVRKILFDNQELMRKNKELEEKNKILSSYNIYLEERIREIKIAYIQLKRDSEEVQKEYLVGIQQNPCQLKSSEAEVFSMFLKGLGNENQKRNINLLKRQDMIPFALDKNQKQFKLENLQKTKKIINGKNAAQSKGNRIFAYKKSVSLSGETGEAETQTQDSVPSCSFDDQLKRSLEGREAELITKLLHYESVIQDLQKTNSQVKAKYDKLKAIIGQTKHH